MRCPSGEFIGGPLFPTSPSSWREQTTGRGKAREIMFKEGLETSIWTESFKLHAMKNGLGIISSELAQIRQACAALYESQLIPLMMPVQPTP